MIIRRSLYLLFFADIFGRIKSLPRGTKVTRSLHELMNREGTSTNNTAKISNKYNLDFSKLLNSIPNDICDQQRSLFMKSKSWQDYYHAAICLHRHKYNDFALEMFLSIYELEESANFHFLKVNIGIATLQRGDAYNAINHFLEYLRFMEPTETCTRQGRRANECAVAFNSLGCAYLSIFEYDKAYDALLKAEKISNINQDRYHIYSNLGAYYQGVSNTTAAAISYLSAFQAQLLAKKDKNIENIIAPLVRRAILVQKIPESVEAVFQMKKDFVQRIRAISSLASHGGAALSHHDDKTYALFGDPGNPSSLFFLEEEIYQLPAFQSSLTDWVQGIQTPHFHFHYYGFHDRPIQEMVADMYTKLCPTSLFEISPHLAQYSTPLLAKSQNVPIAHPSPINQNRDKFRIGFISCKFGIDEPHGLLLIDVVRRLPRNIFETVAFSHGVKSPSQEFVDVFSEGFYHVGHDENRMRTYLKAAELDCLVFGETQNEASVYFQGFQRYAPIQIAVMGSPVTSGNPSIDYFLSGDMLEHPFRTWFSGKRSQDEHYTEQVVLFEGQAISFPPSVENHPTVKVRNYIRSTNHYPPDSNIYMCFQSVFKIQPIFDSVLVKILHADEKGHIVLQASTQAKVDMTFQARISNAVRNHVCLHDEYGTDNCLLKVNKTMSRVHFHDRVPSMEVNHVYKHATVVLAPFPFDGSRTASNAIENGIPIVTLPTKYLRGRMTANFLTTLELHTADNDIIAEQCCIATSIPDYVAKAVRLARDVQYRQKVSLAIQQRSHRIWNDHQVAFEWARFLMRALGVNHIPQNQIAKSMSYSPAAWQRQELLDRQHLSQQMRWKLSRELRNIAERLT